MKNQFLLLVVVCSVMFTGCITHIEPCTTDVLQSECWQFATLGSDHKVVAMEAVPNDTTFVVLSEKDEDYQLTKIGENGTIIWSNSYGNTSQEDVPQLLVIKDADQYVVVGQTVGTEVVSEYFVVNGAGNLSNQQSFLTAFDAKTAFIDSDGAVVIAGNTTNVDVLKPESGAEDVTDMCIAKLSGDLSGLDWQQIFGYNGADDVNDIYQNNDGHYVFVGEMEDGEASFEKKLSFLTINSTSGNTMNIYFSAVDANGFEVLTFEYNNSAESAHISTVASFSSPSAIENLTMNAGMITTGTTSALNFAYSPIEVKQVLATETAGEFIVISELQGAVNGSSAENHIHISRMNTSSGVLWEKVLTNDLAIADHVAGMVYSSNKLFVAFSDSQGEQIAVINL